MKLQPYIVGKRFEECPVCCSSSFMELLKKEFIWPTRVLNFEIKHEDQLCMDCGFVFSRSVPTEEYIAEYYKNAFYSGDSSDVDYNAENRLGFIKNYISARSEILEIGSNNGSFVRFMKGHGFEVNGIDYLDDSAKKIFENKKFDSILMYYMFEHVLDPRSFVGSLERLIKPEGTILIEVPDFETFPYESLNHEHFFHYSPFHLIKIFQAFGFEPIRFSRELKSRYFGFVILFQKTTSVLDEKFSSDPSYYLKKYFDHIHTQYEKRKKIVELEKKINSLSLKKIAVWGMNEVATEFASHLAGKVTLIPVDKNPQKVGLIHLGFSVATNSPECLPEEAPDAIYISAVVFKDQISRAVADMFSTKGRVPEIL